MRIKRTDDAVSEIIETVLLLMMTVVIFSGIYTFVLAPPDSSDQSFVTITGRMEGTNITLTHRGGDSLPLDSLLLVTIGNTTYNTTVGNCLDNESKADGLWDIGEILGYPAGYTAGLEVGVIVTDTISNSVVFTGVLQKGCPILIPTVTTLNATNIHNESATLNMNYDFKSYGSGDVRFSYKKQNDTNWTNTSWNPKSGLHPYHKHITGLSSGTIYVFKAQLRYDSAIPVEGEEKSFEATI